MITGFGNNVVSTLAADITASQTTIQVMPGAGALFAPLLTYDYANTSNNLRTYAKITLTDAKETVFEICHLTAISNDILTVVRAQEGTLAKGWVLNDVIGNFATRGSENQFIQIEQLQSGHYTAAVAGGTENALTLELPATYFLNGSTDWTLRAPVIIYPAKTNTGPSTLQLTLGGRVLGAFSLRKANNVELNAGDLISGVPFCCVLDASKTFFTVINPATAGNVRSVNSKGPDANGNVLLSASDVGALTQDDGDARYVNIEGDTMLGDLSMPNLTAGTVTATNGTIAIRGVFQSGNQYSRLYFVSADGTIVLANLEADFGRNLVLNINGRRFVMDRNGNMFVPGAVYDSGERVFSPNYLPTANQTGALPIGGGTLTGPLLAQGQISTAQGYNIYSAKDVIAANGVYEGDKRVYGPNNPQPIPAKSVASLGNSGWERNIDTGLIRQWGSFVSGSANIESRGFPIAFPTTAVGVYANIGVNGAGNIYVEQDGATSFKSKTTLAGAGVYWEAVGY